MGQRVNALHSLISNHHAPSGFLGTRAALRARVGVTGHRWREDELLRALEHLEASRTAHLVRVAEVAAHRRAEKTAGRRHPAAAEVAALGPPAWQPAPDIELGAVLRHVVDEVLGTDVQRTYLPLQRHTHRVELTSPDGQRHAGLEASPTGWFGVWVLDDLHVSAFTVDYDQVESAQADAVRRMALVARGYLDGSFRVRHRRTLVRRRRQPVVDVVVDGTTWTLRRPAFSR